MLSLPLQSSNPDQYNGKYVASMLVNEGDTVVWWDPTTMQQYANQLGPELVVNGDFSNGTTGWSQQATISVAQDGSLEVSGVVGFFSRSAQIVTGIKPGRHYRLSVRMRRGTAPNGANASFNSWWSPITTSTQFVDLSNIIVADKDFVDLRLLADSNAKGGTSYYDNVSIRELTGTEEALLFSDAAGLFPVTGLEQQVGLVRDRSVQTRFELRTNLFSNSANPYGPTWNWSNGYAGALNPQERLVNGDFSDGLNGWTASSTSLPPYVQDGKLYLTRQNSPLILPSVFSNVVFDPMRRYRIQCELSQGSFALESTSSGGGARIGTGITSGFTAGAGLQTKYAYHNTASVPQPVASRRLYMHSHEAPYSVIDNLSVKQIDEGYVSDPLGGNQAMPLVAEQALATWTETISISIAQTYTISVWIRRKSGTGAVELSCGAGTWTSVPVTGEWAKHRISQSITTGTRTPGIRLATAGDEVEVFGFQFELGATDTDYQPTAYRFPLSWKGNHGYQVTSTARPVLSARYNLLVKSEQFDNAVWSKYQVPLTNNFVTGPFGISAALFVADTNGGEHSIWQYVNFTSGLRYQFSIYLKNHTTTYGIYRFNDNSAFGYNAYVDINLNAQTITGGSGSVNRKLTSLGDGWFKAEFEAVATSTASGAVKLNFCNSARAMLFNGDGVSGVYLGAVDVRVANEPAGIPTYQRINTATDYDSQGFPPYLRFDGVDDFLVTNYIDFTNRDKVTLIAGVRKQVDTASQTVAHLGVDFDAEWAVFALLVGAPAFKYAWYSSGLRSPNLSLAATNDAAYSGTQSAVLEATGTRTPSLNTLRVNGKLAAQSSNSQGLGNFLKAQLYVGATAGTSRRLNGRIYGLIVLGDLADELHLTNARRYLANKTKVQV